MVLQVSTQGWAWEAAEARPCIHAAPGVQIPKRDGIRCQLPLSFGTYSFHSWVLGPFAARKATYTQRSYTLSLRPKTRGSPRTMVFRILLFLWSFGPLKEQTRRPCVPRLPELEAV